MWGTESEIYSGVQWEGEGGERKRERDGEIERSE